MSDVVFPRSMLDRAENALFESIMQILDPGVDITDKRRCLRTAVADYTRAMRASIQESLRTEE